MRGRTVLVVLVALLAISAMPAHAQNVSGQLAVGSQHTTTSEFSSGSLTNMTATNGHIELSAPQTIEGFEDGAWPDDWSGDTGDGSLTTSTVAKGTYALNFGGGDSSGDVVTKSFSRESYDDLSFWVRDSDVTAQRPNIRLKDGSTNVITILADNNGDGSVAYLDSSASPVDTNIELSNDTWYKISLTNIDYTAETFDITVTDAAGNTIGTYSGAGFQNSGSALGGVGLVDFQTEFWFDELATGDGTPASGSYISQTHSVENAEELFVNVTAASNASLTLGAEYWDGSQWVDANETTVTTAANHTVGLPSVDASTWRATVNVSVTGGSPAAQIDDEGYLFDADSPSLSNPDPTGQISNYDGDISINVSDADFGLAQGDEVTVEALDGSGSTIGSQTVASNDTVTISYSAPTGPNSVTWVASDEYGESDTLQQDFATPAELRIANESNPSELVDGSTTVEATFYMSNETVTRNTTNGTVPLAGLSGGEPFVARVEADGYRSRTVEIPGLYQQQTVYLLDENVTAVQTRFTLEDATGTFSEQSTLYVEKPITINGNTSYQVIVGDQFGVDGVTAYFEQGVRYELRIQSQDGDVAQLGAYDGELNETVVLEPSVASVSGGGEIEGVGYSANYSDSTQTIGIQYRDTADLTDSLTVSVVKQNGTVIKPEQTYFDPQSLSLSVPVSGGLNQTAFVYLNGTRDGETISARAPVGPQQESVVPGDLSMPWPQIGAGVGILLVGGLFSALNVAVGATITSLFAGVLWYLGIMSGLASGAAIAIAIGLSTLNLLLRR